VLSLFFRPFGAYTFLTEGTHGLRRGLHSVAASRLTGRHFTFSRDIVSRTLQRKAQENLYQGYPKGILKVQ